VKRTPWLGAGAILVVAAAATAGGLVVSSADHATSAAPDPATVTATVDRGTLSAMVSLSGTLTHRARPDGSPYVAINQARGTYTALPAGGAEVTCGDELHRVDDEPVLLLCGAIPAYRDLRAGDVGNDVRQLNANLHDLGYDVAAGAGIDPDDGAFTDQTEQALVRLQQDRGADATGELRLDRAVFLPEPVRIAEVVGELGGPAQPGSPVARATSATIEVQVALTGSEQRDVVPGDRARIILPGNTSTMGTVDRIGTTAQVAAGQDAAIGPATIAASIRLDDRAQVAGLDHAPVRVEISTEGIDDVLSVPVTAIVGRSGGGFAVEVVRDDGRRELVAVEPGLFDTTAGRVQVEGDLRDGDDVVVPST
jgi:peptidoglycan hydrolase-like protein with peptidoglycan-binding domain